MMPLSFRPIGTVLLFAGAVCACAQPGIQWQKCLGGGNIDNANAVQQTIDGGFIVVGGTYSSTGDVSDNHGGRDVWVVKLDAAGAMEWQQSLGGTSDEQASSVQQTTEGGYIVAGYTASNDGDVIGNHGQFDI